MASSRKGNCSSPSAPEPRAPNCPRGHSTTNSSSCPPSSGFRGLKFVTTNCEIVAFPKKGRPELSWPELCADPHIRGTCSSPLGDPHCGASEKGIQVKTGRAPAPLQAG